MIYTIGLKRSTPHNIVIGGAAGALPPMIGWAAVSANVSLESLSLFAIIFLWTPPHFWALALVRKEEYGGARVPMMPNIAGEDATRRQIFIYAALLLPASLLPFGLGMVSVAYAIAALGLGGLFLVYCRILWAKGGKSRARRLFLYSIFYLFALFSMLLGEAVYFRFFGGAL